MPSRTGHGNCLGLTGNLGCHGHARPGPRSESGLRSDRPGPWAAGPGPPGGAVSLRPWPARLAGRIRPRYPASVPPAPRCRGGAPAYSPPVPRPPPVPRRQFLAAGSDLDKTDQRGHGLDEG